MFLHMQGITIWSDCIRRTSINHPLSMKIHLGKCPVGLDEKKIDAQSQRQICRIITLVVDSFFILVSYWIAVFTCVDIIHLIAE
jgi:hypothetical protein